MQRKFEMWGGTAFGAIVIMAVLLGGGAIVVRNAWPRDPEERDLWEKNGIRPGTVEFHNSDGSFRAFSLNTGPLQPLAPYFAAAGALHDLAVSREKAQSKLDAEAAKKGVAPGKIRPISIGDEMAVAAAAAQGVIMGGRTAAGLLSSVTDYGSINSAKAVASQISPLIPGLPALQEVSRMAGVNLNARLATVWDFMLPLPTSAARKVNLMGDPVGTPDDLQRVVQVLTGGTYPGLVEGAKDADAYANLYASGYRPPSIDPNRGYPIGDSYRPMNNEELAKYTAARGKYFKEELIAAGRSDDPAVARAAYKRANDRALADVGVTYTASTSASPSAVAKMPRMPVRRGIRGPSLRRRSLKLSKGPSLRLRRPSLSIAKARALRGPSLKLKRRRSTRPAAPYKF